MKIGFAICKFDTYYNMYRKPVDIVYSWADIEKYNKKGYETYSKTIFLGFKALEKNKAFNDWVMSTRVAIGIPPKGYSFRKYHHVRRVFVLDTPEEQKTYADKHAVSDKEYQGYIKFRELLDDILDRAEISPILYGREADLYFDTIVYSNFVYPNFQLPDIRCHHLSEWYDSKQNKEPLSIAILHKISRLRLHQWIDKNWHLLDKFVRRLPPPNNFKSSFSKQQREIRNFERDMEIYDLIANKGFSIPKATTRIIKKYGPGGPDCKTNDESVKMAFYRAKTKVDQMFSMKAPASPKKQH